MIHFIVTDPNGRITKRGTASSEALAMLQNSDPDKTVHLIEADPRTQMLVEDELVDRPLIISPPAQVAVGADWHIEAPDGATIYVNDEYLGQADADGATLTFDFPGTKTIRVENAWPLQDAVFSVEIVA